MNKIDCVTLSAIKLDRKKPGLRSGGRGGAPSKSSRSDLTMAPAGSLGSQFSHFPCLALSPPECPQFRSALAAIGSADRKLHGGAEK